MARLSNFRILNPILATTRQIAEVLNGAMNGKLNCTGEFTISSGTTTTTVTDPRAGVDSMILFTGIGHDISHVHPWMSSRSDGSFVVGHQNHGHDVDVGYVIIG